MKTFLVLLKKEIRELITLQLVLPIILIVVIFFFVGKVLGAEREKSDKEQIEITVIDNDKTDYSSSYLKSLEGAGFKVNLSSQDISNLLNEEKGSKDKLYLIINSNFSDDIQNNRPSEMDLYTSIKKISISSSARIQTAFSKISALNQFIGQKALVSSVGEENAQFISSPVIIKDITYVNGKSADISPSEVYNFVMTQTTFIPIVLFLVITLASQLVATSIASEKENKTLETLLSCPINRKAIVASKLMAAGIISLIFALAYLFAMNNYLSGLTGQSIQTISGLSRESIFKELGLVFSFSDYLMLGSSIFLGILGGLSIAFILGSIASDSKSAQATISPLMVMLIIPYILSMLVDISSLPILLKIFVYAIPFTHIFIAPGNIILNNFKPLILGDLYLLIFVGTGIFLASKIMGSEKIMTFRLKLFKKSNP